MAMTDPLEALRSGIVPVAPDPGFAAGLRRRLELMLTDQAEQEDHMTDVLLRGSRSRNGTRHGDVSYITLAVPDASAARRFYGRVLGWTFAPGKLEEEGNQVDLVIPQMGLWQGSAWREGVSAGAIPSWRVDDLRAAAEAVRAAGGTATDPAERPYGLEAECSDGHGLRFWLHQLPASGQPAHPNGERQGDVSYIVLRVADLQRGEQLFSSVLGWSYSPGASGVHVQGPAPMTGMSEGPPGVVLCHLVDDVADAVEHVGAAGGRPGRIEQRPYGLESLCTDDQGIEFYLHQLAT
jgi:predicted enzyme related to lactoylglutathione lyase